MKPKPFSALTHFTVPDAILNLPRGQCRDPHCTDPESPRWTPLRKTRKDAVELHRNSPETKTATCITVTHGRWRDLRPLNSRGGLGENFDAPRTRFCGGGDS